MTPSLSKPRCPDAAAALYARALRHLRTPKETDADLSVVLSFLNAKSHLKGARIILALIHNADEPISVLSIATMLDKKITDLGIIPFLGSYVPEFEPMPMTDPTAIHLCKKEMRKLIDQIAALEFIGMNAEAEAKRAEYRVILKYIQRCTMPGGKIRFFPGNAAKAYARVRKDFLSILAEAENCSPEAAYIIRRHVRSGTRFCWRSMAEQRRLEQSNFLTHSSCITETRKNENHRADDDPRAHRE